ncbi:MAG: polyphosphate kinase 2 family protein [Phycisphaerae bacterium]
MNADKLLDQAHEFSKAYRVTDGDDFKLKRFDPADTGDLGAEDKPRAKEALASAVEQMSAMQERLYAQDKWAVLLIFQAMDAAGKDGVIKHVMSGVNPQGCQVRAFKAPTAEELDHDYLWRCNLHLPERGRIGIFNRSYYEEVLVVRVHPQILQGQNLPPELVGDEVWDERFEDIRDYERYLSRNGVLIRKFFLHVSRKEQKKRFMERLDNPAKNWKFSAADVRERAHWDRYMQAYEEMIRNTAAKHAPWYVVPADNKWFTRLVVSAAVIDALASLKLKFPEVGDEKRKELAAARQALTDEGAA